MEVGLESSSTPILLAASPSFSIPSGLAVTWTILVSGGRREASLARSLAFSASSNTLSVAMHDGL
ncbi:hypothetical protein D1872_319240 [compost metagenome]